MCSSTWSAALAGTIFGGNHIWYLDRIWLAFPGVLLEEDNPGPVAAVETKTLDPNVISDAASSNSSIKHITGLRGDSDAPTSIYIPINPTPETQRRELSVLCYHKKW